MVVAMAQAGHSDGMERKHFTMRMSPEERDRLTRLADLHGLSAVSFIRMLLRREELAAGPALAKPAKKVAAKKASK